MPISTSCACLRKQRPRNKHNTPHSPANVIYRQPHEACRFLGFPNLIGVAGPIHGFQDVKNHAINQ
jgi:hypothetical protein